MLCQISRTEGEGSPLGSMTTPVMGSSLSIATPGTSSTAWVLSPTRGLFALMAEMKMPPLGTSSWTSGY